MIRFNRINKEELRDWIAQELGVTKDQVTDEVLLFMEKAANAIGTDDEYFFDRRETEAPGKGLLGLLIPKIYYFVNLKKATWSILKALLQYGITSNSIAVLITVGDDIIKAFSRLSRQNGEACVVLTALSLRKKEADGFTEVAIKENLQGKPCRHQDFECRYNKEAVCFINEENIKNLINILHTKGVIYYSDDGKWKLVP